MADTTQDTQDQTTQPTGGLSQVATQVKMTPGGKGQLATLSTPSGVLMNEESSKAILTNMQKMLDEYNSPYKQFQDSLKEAHAWTKYDKIPAFQQLQAEQEQDRANKYNIAQSMASFQANQATNQNLAKSLLSTGAGGVQGAPTTAQASAGLMAQSPVDDYTQAEIDRLILQEGNVGAAAKMREKAYANYSDQSMRNRFNVDLDAPVSDVLVNGVKRTITRRAFAKMAESNPGILQENPQLAKEITNSGNTGGVPTFSDPSINVTSAQRNAQQQQALYKTSVDNGTPGVQPNGIPVAKPGTSPHETLPPGDVLDIDPTKLTTSGRTELAQKGYYQPYGKDSPHWQKIPPVGPTTANPTQPKSVAEYESNIKKGEAANQEFIDSTVKPLAAKVAAKDEDITNAKQILGSIESGGKFGPGTSIDQALSTALQAVGVKPNKQEQINYLNNLNIEQARQLFSASGARAAMGAQFTENESNRFLKTLAGINDPKEYIKQVYQLKIAEAKLNQARLDYIRKNPLAMEQADRDWRNSSERERILRENAPLYMKISDKADAAAKKDTAPAMSTTRPAGAPKDARLGTDANGQPGWFVTRNGKNLQWKP
jgi:hypothetical protein